MNGARPARRAPKVESWTAGSRLLSFGWLVVWILAGSYLLFVHSRVVGGLYFALWAAQYLSCRYLACTRCVYYGRKCHMLGGDCAKLLFAERPHGRRMPDDALVGIWWAIVTLFPIPFLIAWRSWLALGMYVAISIGWHVAHHFVACRRCSNTHCPLNPDRAQSATVVVPE